MSILKDLHIVVSHDTRAGILFEALFPGKTFLEIVTQFM